MALGTAFEKLKGRPKHEQKALAAGIAIAVVVILFFGWVIYFFRALGNTELDVSTPPGLQENVFNMDSVNEARQEIIGNLEEAEKGQAK